MNLSEELEKLRQLHQTGALSAEEFAQAKAKLLNAPPAALAATPGPALVVDPVLLERDTRQWAMFLHLSVLAGSWFPSLCVLGVVFPIMAAVKANNGEVRKYLLSLTFLK
jgi:Short C-terminal domain